MNLKLKEYILYPDREGISIIFYSSFREISQVYNQPNKRYRILYICEPLYGQLYRDLVNANSLLIKILDTEIIITNHKTKKATLQLISLLKNPPYGNFIFHDTNIVNCKLILNP